MNIVLIEVIYLLKKIFLTFSELGKHLLAGAETFDTRIWVAAVAIVMGTLLILATATIYALYKECRLPLGMFACYIRNILLSYHLAELGTD